jgi:hypothetical protein
LVDASGPEWYRIHQEKQEEHNKAAAAQEFYKAVKEVEVTRTVSALKSLQEMTAALSDEKRATVAKYHGTLRGGHIKDADKLVRKVSASEPEESYVTLEEVQTCTKLCPDCQKVSWQHHTPTGYHPKLDTLDPASNYADVLVLAVLNAPTRPQQRRRSTQSVYQYIAGRPIEAPGYNSTPVEPPITEFSADEIFDVPSRP